MTCKSCTKFRCQETTELIYWCEIEAKENLNLGFPRIGNRCEHFDYAPGSDEKEDEVYDYV
jgi:L,D-peptidoglycan transpeptidase YkuD (ErfK/YbiS/YcfS/YnhG family)